jgi:hypothetical protein
LKNKYDISIKIKVEGGKYKRAYLNMENSRKLISIIKDIVPETMYYKISLQRETPYKNGDDIVWSTRINKGVEEAEMTSRLESI